MGTFGPGILLDSTTMRPVAGRVLKVLEVGTDLPLVSDPPVVATNSRGYYGQFSVEGQDAVLIRAGGAGDEVIAALDRTIVRELSALADVFVALAQDGDVLTRDAGVWVPRPPQSGTSVTLEAGAGIDISYDPGTRTYIITATGGGSGGDETLFITHHSDGTVTYSGTAVSVSGDSTEYTISFPGLVVSGDGLEFTVTSA